jgi:hypothetical protein
MKTEKWNSRWGIQPSAKQIIVGDVVCLFEERQNLRSSGFVRIIGLSLSLQPLHHKAFEQKVKRLSGQDIYRRWIDFGFASFNVFGTATNRQGKCQIEKSITLQEILRI